MIQYRSRNNDDIQHLQHRLYLDEKISDVIEIDVRDVNIYKGGPVVLLVWEGAHSTLHPIQLISLSFFSSSFSHSLKQLPVNQKRVTLSVQYMHGIK
jgi:hypothetical protein